MERKLIVATVATRIPDHVARGDNRRTVRHEIKCSAGVVRIQVVSREIARAVDADRIGGGGIESGGFGLERIGILARPDLSRRAARIRGGLIG